jgi:hypothetical protein
VPGFLSQLGSLGVLLAYLVTVIKEGDLETSQKVTLKHNAQGRPKRC